MNASREPPHENEWKKEKKKKPEETCKFSRIVFVLSF